ncbi:response regulator [Undibacterium sp. TJN25]|uniref:response regulator n=1 Tax=Undibacterium sp. TJN25 TaxID=3413056 RepID=UPI003BF216E0
MAGSSTLDQADFRRILARNVTIPLATGIGSALVFVALMIYLISTLDWVDHTHEAIAHANDVSKLVTDEQTSVRGFLITGDENYLAPFMLAKSKIASALPSLADFVNDNPIQVDRVKRIIALHRAWEAYAVGTIELRRQSDKLPYARVGGGRAEYEEMRKEFDDFVQHEQGLLKERNDSAKSVSFGGAGLFVIFSLVLSVILAIFGRRELVGLSTTYNNALVHSTEQAKILEQQAWQRSGQNELVEKTIGESSVQQLGRSLLDFLASYLDAAVGALYVRDASGTLTRAATYGFSKESEAMPQTFRDAESLVGQAALSKRVIRLDNVPDSYLTVNSGLGATLPKSIVLVPIDQERDGYGVVELGFMHALTARDLEFLTLVAPRIGATVASVMSRLRLQDALAETQQLNEELQTQQEELRAANEELEEQSRVLEQSQANLENQRAELQQTNHVLAEQAMALDQKNIALNTAQHELEQRALDLQRASKYKSEFLANMSHELRTPLNSSLILSKLLADNQPGNLSPEQVKFAQTIYSSGNDLLNLINDILDISKVEAGKLELDPEDIPVASLAESIRATFAPLASQKALTFTVDIQPDAPAAIFSDRQRVEQILKNLLSNAVKFTEAGQVKMTVTSGAHGAIVFAVEDSGIGIATEQQKIIFEAFQQADGTTSRKYGGTGLGLSISRELASLLGGAITVESAIGKGSTFTLTLPPKLQLDTATPAVAIAGAPLAAPSSPAREQVFIAQVRQPAAAPAPAILKTPSAQMPAFPDDRHQHGAGNKRTVLVIEDEPDFARILYDLAHEMQYQCLVAMTASEGLQMAADFLPDAILLDIKLPDASGMSVLQKLKTTGAIRHIPVHIVSATDRVQVALQQGAVGYAVKPTTREQLKQVFEKLESKFSQTTKRVLLVEDDDRQRESVMELIGSDNVEITAVGYGNEALELLRTSIFDCMIIDLKLPDIQGQELLQRMASEEIFSFPPVIVYTGRQLTRSEEAELQKYSRSIIIKGARSPERLLDEVTLFLHKVESELPTDRQAMLKNVRNRDQILEGRRILLVDDDIRNIFALTSALEQKGAKVEIGRDGFEAIRKLDEVSDIDMVLMDVMMPGMDGLEATRNIRKDARFQKLPIIGITAKAMKDDQEQCLNAGMSDYLAKPIDLERLYSLLRVWMPNIDHP